MQRWAAVSEKVRTPLGTVLTRTFLSEEHLPATLYYGYEVFKFRTSFANKPDTVETVTLERESGEWREVEREGSSWQLGAGVVIGIGRVRSIGKGARR